MKFSNFRHLFKSAPKFYSFIILSAKYNLEKVQTHSIRVWPKFQKIQFINFSVIFKKIHRFNIFHFFGLLLKSAPKFYFIIFLTVKSSLEKVQTLSIRVWPKFPKIQFINFIVIFKKDIFSTFFIFSAFY